MRYQGGPGSGDRTGTGPRTAPGDGSGTWVPVAEAARRLGVSARAVRKRVERGTLTARPRGNEGREVYLPDGPSSGPVPDPGSRTGSGSGNDPHAAAVEEGLRARVEQLLERAACAEGAVAGLREALTREAAHVATLTEALAKAEARADRLEAALLEARRPWLARVLEGLRRKG